MLHFFENCTKALQKFNGTLNVHIIANKEASPLHLILRYLKELWIKPIFTHAVSLKMELFKKFENELDFAPQQHLFLFSLQL